MNQELLTVLDHLEREKGVSREVLIETIESALVSAARKVLKDKESDIDVKINLSTGDIEVFSEGKKVKSEEFGRIAAQTAKQVIIQKIRDAERDVVYDEFEPKVNHVVSGTIFRYEHGTVIIDLGKTEAILPKREQSPRDVYRQGDRIRVYVLEVSKETKGPQIIVSRTQDGLVKRLFEMEVPEVLESIVEIKSVSREPGDRAKIAVWSKDEKIDCVGACVGMRGSRVKNVVRELHGEKIDIVRWSDNIVEYVKAALNPAECVSIDVADAEEKKINVVVDNDQLSLAIGKNGQNVRLASKLTGWNIDIQPSSPIEEGKAEEGSEEAKEESSESKDQDVAGSDAGQEKEQTNDELLESVKSKLLSEDSQETQEEVSDDDASGDEAKDENDREEAGQEEDSKQ